MKFLYLGRHGKATPPEMNPDQPLSKIGKKESEQMAKMLNGIHLKIDTIVHSTKLRTKETAEIYGSKLSPEIPLIEKEGLKPMDPIGPILEEILYENDSLMIIGHLPFLEKVLTTLLFGEEKISPFDFCESSLICLTEEGGSWKISWAISPKVLNL